VCDELKAGMLTSPLEGYFGTIELFAMKKLRYRSTMNLRANVAMAQWNSEHPSELYCSKNDTSVEAEKVRRSTFRARGLQHVLNVGDRIDKSKSFPGVPIEKKAEQGEGDTESGRESKKRRVVGDGVQATSENAEHVRLNLAAQLNTPRTPAPRSSSVPRRSARLRTSSQSSAKKNLGSALRKKKRD